MKRVLVVIGIFLLAGGLFYFFFARSGGGGGQRSIAVPTDLKAVIASTTGTVVLAHADGSSEPAHAGLTLTDGDTVTTGADGEASLEFFDGSRTALFHATGLKITQASIDRSNWKKQVVHLELLNGRIWSRILRLLDVDSAYDVTANNVIASVRGTAFQTTAQGPLVTFDQFDGQIGVDGSATGTLHTGLSVRLDTAQQGLVVNGSTVFFTPDQTRNDHWIRAQLRLDTEFARRAAKIRHNAGVDEDVSNVGNEAGPFTMDMPGTEHTFEGVSIDLNGTDEHAISEGQIFQLKAIALLQHKDGNLEQRDVTGEATWQTTDPDHVTVDKGKVTVQSGAMGQFKIIARWDDGTHEHSGQYDFSIQGGTTIDTSVGPILINGKPLQ